MRAPERASEAGRRRRSCTALLGRELTDRGDISRAAAELGVDLASGGASLVVRAHAHVPGDDGWRARVLAVAERGARAARAPARWPRSSSGPRRPGAEVVVLVPGGDERRRPRAPPRASLRELQAALPGLTLRARAAAAWPRDPVDLARAGNEALLAANVAEGDAEHAGARLRRHRRLPAAAARR